MNRKGIVIKRVSIEARNVLAQKHGYQIIGNSQQLSGSIYASPEYDSWKSFFGDLSCDFYEYDSKSIHLIWIPGFHSISEASRNFVEHINNPGELFEYLLGPAETHRDAVVQYGDRIEYGERFQRVFHDRLTFRMDERGRIYCVRAVIPLINLGNYTGNGFNDNGSEDDLLVCSYYHRSR